VLFTAFEPSGDDHASAVIAELRARRPDLGIHAWGGPRMAEAGATIVERTGEDAVMGLPGIEKIVEHKRINTRIERWLDANPVAVHVPVDSPAANFPVCAMAKARGIRVVHLVAPQIWAWARWRIHKLRRLTDLVLCLLPFEERFFARRDVPARFIGHFLFDEPPDEAALDLAASSLPGGEPRIGMFPGSRPGEWAMNFPLLLDAFERIRKEFPGATGVIAATRPEVETQLRQIAAARLGAGAGRWPPDVTCVVAGSDAVIRWSTICLVKSGTVTLQATRQLKPMVIVYKKKLNVPLYIAAKAMLSTKHFALPNVIAARRIIPEFVPHFGGAGPIARAAIELLRSPEAMEQQRADLRSVVDQYRGHNARRTAADEILRVLDLTPGAEPRPTARHRPATTAP